MKERYDKIIVGAGLYGLYAALYCGQKGQKILVLECEQEPFTRATYINQARVHQGYHYPRSISTAMKSAGYFERFQKDFAFCINKEFEKIYATSAQYSYTDGERFKKFCHAAGIACKEIHPDNFFKKGLCDGAFVTREYTYDAIILRDYYLNRLKELSNVKILFNKKIQNIARETDVYICGMDSGEEYEAPYILNATYAATNQILDMLKMEKFKIKYELCEIILCTVDEELKKYGITVMDGPFFSIMPFGKTGLHSLTSVTFTPHTTSYSELPEFECQRQSMGVCDSRHLGNCNSCVAKPDSAFPYMEKLTRKYLKDDFDFFYEKSLFSMKPILMSSEIDDSRPTVIRTYTKKPTFVSVLSGKINTVYDLDEVLEDE